MENPQIETKIVSPREFQAIETIPRFFSVPQLLDLAISTSMVISVGQSITEDAAEFQANSRRYKLRHEQDDSGHRYGDGGEYGRYNLLRVNEQDVLVSMWYHAYDTYSDDSEDHGRITIKQTHLLQNDLVARLMFEEVKTKLKRFLQKGEKREAEGKLTRPFRIVREFLRVKAEESKRVSPSHHISEEYLTCNSCKNFNVLKGFYYVYPKERMPEILKKRDAGDMYFFSVCLDCLNFEEKTISTRTEKTPDEDK